MTLADSKRGDGATHTLWRFAPACSGDRGANRTKPSVSHLAIFLVTSSRPSMKCRSVFATSTTSLQQALGLLLRQNSPKSKAGTPCVSVCSKALSFTCSNCTPYDESNQQDHQSPPCTRIVGLSHGRLGDNDLMLSPPAQADSVDPHTLPLMVYFQFYGGWDLSWARPGDHSKPQYSEPSNPIHTGYDVLANSDPETAAVMAATNNTGLIVPSGSNIRFGLAMGRLTEHS